MICDPTQPIPKEAWILTELLWARLMSGALTSEEIPAPSVRSESSSLLDELESTLFVDDSVRDSATGLVRDRVVFRLARFLSRDDAPTVVLLLDHLAPRGVPSGARLRFVVQALLPQWGPAIAQA